MGMGMSVWKKKDIHRYSQHLHSLNSTLHINGH